MLRELAAVYKKSGRYEDAVEVWRGEFRRTGAANAMACIELAKLYERYLRNPAAALEFIEQVEQRCFLKHYA